MRLIIREYLSMLREAGELDALVPDLLLAMGITPHSRAQRGSRQHGVDLAAAGKDPDAGNTQTLFLFVIKQGDVGRSEWDGNPQAVRPSLNEIMDVYLHDCVEPRHAGLRKKVVLCCGGDLKQEVAENWKGYAERVRTSERAELDFWGADKLAELISTYLLDEYLFPESARKRMRKTLALLGDVDYDLSDFYGLVKDLLSDTEDARTGHRSTGAKRAKQLRLLHLCLNVVFHWAEEDGNLKPAYLAGEHALLRTWDWVREHRLYSDRKLLRELHKIHATYGRIGGTYLARIASHCYVRDGLSGYMGDELEYPLRVFEVIGILGVLGIDQAFLHEVAPDSVPAENAQVVGDTLEALIRHNPAAVTPLYDGHAIDICLGLLLLFCCGRREAASWWLQELIGRIGFAYHLGRDFPIASDSYDDLIAMQIGQAPAREKLMQFSTLLPMLAQWCIVFDQGDTYQQIRDWIHSVFTQTNLQLWHPDENTDEWLYRAYAARKSGSTQASIRLPETLEGAREQIQRLQQDVVQPESVSCIAHGLPVLALIASRHFRTPVLPFFWQRLVASTSGSPS